jgi:hypothetical protein
MRPTNKNASKNTGILKQAAYNLKCLRIASLITPIMQVRVVTPSPVRPTLCSRHRDHPIEQCCAEFPAGRDFAVDYNGLFKFGWSDKKSHRGYGWDFLGYFVSPRSLFGLLLL